MRRRSGHRLGQRWRVRICGTPTLAAGCVLSAASPAATVLRVLWSAASPAILRSSMPAAAALPALPAVIPRRLLASTPLAVLGSIEQAGEPTLGRLPLLQSAPEDPAAGLGAHDKAVPDSLRPVPALVADEKGHAPFLLLAT